MLCIGITEDIKRAAGIIKAGGLVAFPTETVYGLGADAFNADAVAKIYFAKGRPGDNPLITHIANKEDFFKLADNSYPYTEKLIKTFWPGALTLIVKKKPLLPPWLGGHPNNTAETLGIRMPAHETALALITAAGCPISAPSANKAGKPSPTCAEHVADDYLLGEIDLVLQGEASDIGIESTVLDVTTPYPIILRPGAVTASMIEKVTGLKCEKHNTYSTNAPKSPGMKYRHYAPKAPMTVLQGTDDNIIKYVAKNCIGYRKVGFLSKSITTCLPENVVILTCGADEKAFGQNIFACLREFDKLGVDKIYAQAAADTEFGTAIMDRLLKAAEGNIINV